MAKSTGKKNPPKNAAPPKPKDDDGWSDVSSDRRAPWLVKEEGIIVEGVLLGRFTMNQQGKTKGFYQVKLTVGEIEAVQGRGEDRETVILERGDTVSIDESKALEDLRPLCEDGGKYQVRLTFGKREELPGGNTFWNIKIQKKVLSPPTRVPAPTSAPDRTGKADPEDDLTFWTGKADPEDDLPF